MEAIHDHSCKARSFTALRAIYTAYLGKGLCLCDALCQPLFSGSFTTNPGPLNINCVITLATQAAAQDPQSLQTSSPCTPLFFFQGFVPNHSSVFSSFTLEK